MRTCKRGAGDCKIGENGLKHVKIAIFYANGIIKIIMPYVRANLENSSYLNVGR